VVDDIHPSTGPTIGQTYVTLVVRGFEASANCYFGKIEALSVRRVSSTTLVCQSPQLPMAMNPNLMVSVDVTNNNADFAAGITNFLYENIIKIFSISPESTVPGSLITLIGDGFGSKDVYCKFAATNPVLCSSSSTRVRTCPLPDVAILGKDASIVSISLSTNQADYLQIPFILRIQTLPNVASFSPSVGPVNGGTKVIVTGFFGNATFLFAFFGETQTRCVVSNSTTLICFTPSQRSGETTFSLKEFTNTVIMDSKFLYHDVITIASSKPIIGPTLGGTIVEISLKRSLTTYEDVLSEKAKCKFDSFVVNAELKGSGMICVTPPSNAGLTSIYVSYNGVDYSDSSSIFEFRDPLLTTMYPSSASVQGGTLVIVEGSGFVPSANLSVSFGGVRLIARWLSENRLTFSTPKFSVTGLVEVEISINGVQNTEIGSLFEVQDAPTISRITPSFGAATGNTLVTVFGTHFYLSSALTCRIGTVLSQAQFLTSNVVICKTPGFIPGIVTISISNNAVDFEASSTFYYLTSPIIRKIFPSAGATSGHTLVTLTGEFEYGNWTWACRFGDLHAIGFQISLTELTCIAPAKVEGLVAVEISNNKQDYTTSNLQFLYQKPLQVLKVIPTSGPSASGASVTVIGKALSAGAYTCFFGEKASPGKWKSSESIVCESPPGLLGSIAVEISLNGQDVSKSNVAFFAYSDPEVTALSPYLGLVAGGNPVFISGSKFLNSSDASCRFGSKVVRAIFLASTNVICVAPPQAEGSISVEFSNNGNDFTNSKIIYHYISCPSGSFCPEFEIVNCPMGAYCPGKGLFNFTLCSPGTYQGTEGQSSCLRCPLGKICPDFGISAPLQCPAGYVCDTTGLMTGLKLCPPGHYCNEGTKTSDAFNTAEALRPIPCPEGFYCTAGVVTPVSVALNFSTAQPCYPGYFCAPGSETPHGQGPCPSGFHCPLYSPGIAKACPATTMCPGVGNMDPLDCRPGFFNNIPAQSNCSLCPIGNICPEYKQAQPQKCPAGYVCEFTGLPAASSPCPAGYYCIEGVVTSNASALISPKPIPCKAGTYCAIGVRTDISIPNDLTTPQSCAEGTYCQEATGSPQGTAPCPAGFFCQAGSVTPVAADPGNYVKRAGSVIQTKCNQGTYTAVSGSSICMQCPSGHSCAADNTSIPVICPKGTYRTSDPLAEQQSSVACVKCPPGTFSVTTGLIGLELCEPCPAGIVCGREGIKEEYTTSNACPEGYVCPKNTNSNQQFDIKCPAGFSCDFGTTPETQFDVKCEAGYGCTEGVSTSQKNRLKCEIGYFCPEGSTSAAPPDTKCPVGTTSQAAAQKVEDCVKDPNVLAGRICRVSPWYNQTFDECLLNLKCCRASKNGLPCNEKNTEYSACVTDGKAEAQYDWSNLLKDSAQMSNNFIEAKGLQITEITLDFQGISKRMKYGDHYQLVIYYFDASCGLPGDVKTTCTNGVYLHSPPLPLMKDPDQPDTLVPTVNSAVYSDKIYNAQFGEYLVNMQNVLKFSLMPMTEDSVYFRLEVEILHGLFIETKDYTAFWNTMSIKSLRAKRAVFIESDIEESLQFAAVVDRDTIDENNLLTPSNIPKTYTTVDNVADQIDARPLIDFVSNSWDNAPLSFQRFADAAAARMDPASSGQTSMKPVAGVGTTRDNALPSSTMLVLPYFPFFSACDKFDSHMYTFQVLENSECKFSNDKQLRPVDQIGGIFAPRKEILLNGGSDLCSYQVRCKYEEPISEPSNFAYWFKTPEDSALFSLAADALNTKQFDSHKDSQYVSMFQGTSLLVPVTVIPPEQQYQLDNAVPAVPRDVYFSISYWQKDAKQKRIITAEIRFENWDKNLEPLASAGQYSNHSRYNLHIDFQAMAWLELLNQFAFEIQIFILIYIAGDFIIILITVVFWAVHRLCTRLQDPPKLFFREYFNVIELPLINGFCLGFAPIVAVMLVIYVTHMIPLGEVQLEQSASSAAASVPAMLWDRISDDFTFGTEFRVNPGRKNAIWGRCGFAFLFAGFWILIKVSLENVAPMNKKKTSQLDELLGTNPDSSSSDADSASEESLAEKWYRTQVLVAIVLQLLKVTVMFEISFSEFWGNNPYACGILVELLSLVWEQVLAKQCKDQYTIEALMACDANCTTIMMMGANTFMDFFTGTFTGYFIYLLVTVYIMPAIDYALELASRLTEYVQATREISRRMREEALEIDPEDAPQFFDIFNIDDANPVDSILGYLGGYQGDTIVLFYSPIIIFMVATFNDQIPLGLNYGVNRGQFQFYYFSQLILIPATLLSDIFIHNIMELHYGWKLFEYTKYAAHRFKRRTCRWKMHDGQADESLDESVRSMDQSCFSSQYNTIQSLFVGAFMLLALGLQSMLRLNYNPFQDKAAFLISIFSVVYLNLLQAGFLFLGEKLLWRIDAESALIGDDGLDIGIELRIPEWKEAEGPSGRHEIKSLGFGSFEDVDSDDFKSKFLEKNRPWILKQLKLMDNGMGAKNLLTEEMLESNNQWDLGEYVRDDISDDSGSDDGAQIRAKSSIQLAPGSRKILRLWLVSTRRRLGLPDMVAERFDISSESESDEDQKGGRKAVKKPNQVTKKIGHMWLSAIRGHLQPAAKIAVDVSDDSDDDNRSKQSKVQVTQISAVTREIGRQWLSSISRSSSTSVSKKAAVLSSSDGSDSDAKAKMKPNTKKIAILWKQMLQKAKAETAERFRQANPGLISSDSPSGDTLVPSAAPRAQATRLVGNISDSDEESSEVGVAQEALRIPVKTKIIAQRWLNMIRSRSR